MSLTLRVSIIAQESDPFVAIPKALWIYLSTLSELPTIQTFATLYNFSTLNIFIKSTDRTLMLDSSHPSIDTLQAMRAAGTKIYALCGEPTWATKTTLPNQIADLINLNNLYSIFDGLHLDIEPASLPEWDLPNGQRDLMQGTANFISLVDSNTTLPIALAVQPVHALTPLVDGQDFLAHVAPHIEEISIMAYRNDPAKQITRAEPCFKRAQALNLRWKMGTLCNPPTEANTSYYGFTPTQFKLSMNQLWTSIYPEVWLTGLVFENYETIGLILN